MPRALRINSDKGTTNVTVGKTKRFSNSRPTAIERELPI